MQPALRCQNIDVRFGAVNALKDVSVRFEAGKIHALLGQNGAGKSTIARVISGVLSPQNGSLEILGQSVTPGDTAATQAAGLDVVHQRFALPPTFSVAEALEFASVRKMGGRFYTRRAVETAWKDRLDEARINVDPRARLSTLPVETAQSIEIVRALANDAKVLVLDEPTALLSPPAITALFDKLHRLRNSGVTLVVILHKLREVMDIADTVTILRSGALVLGPKPMADMTDRRISEAMIGTAATHGLASRQAPGATATTSLLRFDTVSSRNEGGEVGLKDISFDLKVGEILGVAGVEGNGQRALAEIFAGLRHPIAGNLFLADENVTDLSVSQRRRRGLRAVPFDRMTEGSSLTLSLWENTKTWMARTFRKGPWPNVSLREIQDESRRALDHFGVIYETPDQPAGTLSGGNLQRVILARELTGRVTALLAAQPTRGLDFGATNFVWNELDRVRRRGAAVILISSDLDELFGICDRIIVMRSGRITGSFQPPYAAGKIGAAMVGTL